MQVVYTPNELRAFHRSHCAAIIWQRNPAPGFQTWIDALAAEFLPRARVTLRPQDVREVATQICELSGMRDCWERKMLVDDTAVLASIFAELMNVKFVRFRYDVVSTNACRKFHIDYVTARLICTYRGPGTLYGFTGPHEEPSKVFSVPTGAPILLRGKLWPESPNAGLKHRSPPIEDTGETRLVLVIDPVVAPDNDR